MVYYNFVCIVAELMPVATPEINGLMSASDKKNSLQVISIGKTEARRIININSLYTQFLFIGFFTVTGSALNCILSGRSASDINKFQYNLTKITESSLLNIYIKDNSFYIKNESQIDPCLGFIISNFIIDNENINIDESYTLLT